MVTSVTIDEIDIKIINALMKDSRTSLKEIAKECNVSSNAIFKRIKQLEGSGVIMGYSLLMSTKTFGPRNLTAIWLTIDLTREAEAMEYLHKQNRFNIFRCAGSYDIIAYYISNNMQELEQMLHDLKKQEWSRKVIVNIINENKISIENVKLEQTAKRRDEKVC